MPVEVIMPKVDMDMASGKLKIEIGQRFALADAAKAHIELSARRTTGSTVLLP